MKNCAYCGRENDAGATCCRECGTNEFVDETSPKIEIHHFGSLKVGGAVHEKKGEVCLVWKCPKCESQQDFHLSTNQIFITFFRLDFLNPGTLLYLKCVGCEYELNVNLAETALLKKAAEFTKAFKAGTLSKESYLTSVQGLSANFVKDLSALTEVWKCSKCGEQNPISFDSCWQCGPQASESVAGKDQESFPKGLLRGTNPWDF